MTKIDAIIKMIIGVLLLFTAPITYINAETAMRINHIIWHSAEQDGGVVRHYDTVHELYQTTPIFHVIGVIFIVWGIIQIGVDIYEHSQSA